MNDGSDWRGVVGRNAYNPHLVSALVAASAALFTTGWAAIWVFLLGARVPPMPFLILVEPPLLGFVVGLVFVSGVAYVTTWVCWWRFVTKPARLDGERARNAGIAIGVGSYLVLSTAYLAVAWILTVVASDTAPLTPIELAPELVVSDLAIAVGALFVTAGLPIVISVYVTTRVARLHHARTG